MKIISRNVLFIFLPVMLVYILTAGCKKLIEIDLPSDQISSSNVFKDSITANSALTGIYSQMISNIDFQWLVGPGMALYADELEFSLTNADYIEINDCNIAPQNRTLNSFWQLAYSNIYQANLALEQLAKTNALSISLHNRLTSEALFIRSFCNYYLVQTFGGIPLITSTNYLVNQSIKRSEVNAVYAQIIADLQKAHELAGKTTVSYSNIRPDIHAISALLARAYLQTKQWDAAEKAASSVIESGNYLPLPDVSAVFLNNSKETIWQLFPAAPGRGSNDGSLYMVTDAVSIPAYVVRDELVAQFTQTDKRLLHWLGVNTVGGKPYYYPAKYKVRTVTSGASAAEYQVVFRLAELILLRAEARMFQDKLIPAINDLNLIRNRAGLAPLADDMPKPLIEQEIKDQRRMELFTEWGHRWIDLKRFEMADAVLGPLKGSNWQSTDTLFPVPAPQRVANPGLDQNEGYNK